MTRPEIIRADSIDLQDQSAPSAKDHSRQHALTNSSSAATHAPHQAETLREVQSEVADEIGRSPRVSREWTNGEVQHLQQYGDGLAAGVSSKLNGTQSQQQDNLADAQNGGLTGSTAEDADMADAEGDDGMDDDMMDKISSSPSIDDGGYSLPHLWPQRSDSLTRTPVRTPSRSQACGGSSSPFVETPTHFPLRVLLEVQDKDTDKSLENQKESNRHLSGEYAEFEDDLSYYINDEPEAVVKYQEKSELDEGVTAESTYDSMDYYVDEHLSQYLDLRGKNDRHFVLQDDNSAAITVHSQELTEALNESADELTTVIKEEQHDVLRDAYPKETYPMDDASSDEGYDTEDDQDDDYDFSQRSASSRFIDSGWGGECLQNVEDIDFEFVYALHTFVATVEGQANATKGDTMVLLDDSNSYWWLVRVVKDSSIGYLPAEHIETPTERLARLNKHRNIDLTSTMLGDQAEKSKNPLKKAIRRRNAKTVTFTAPTYVEASDVDYSTEEEDGEGDYFGQTISQEQNGDQQEQAAEEDEITAVEPLKARAEVRDLKPDPTESESISAASGVERDSDEILDGRPESKSRNGTLRNTDSFFKDDSVETRKITLTPNLLRDDSSTSTRASNDSKDAKRPSLDKLEKDSPEKSKDKKDKKDKKEKEKKSGMLSGLFKRKDKKTKSIDDEIEEVMAGKFSNENVKDSSSSSKDSEEIMAIMEGHAALQQPDMQRHPSKLQKQSRTEISPARKVGQVQAREPPKNLGAEAAAAADRTAPSNFQAPSMRLVQPEPAVEQSAQESRFLPPDNKGPTASASPKETKSNGPIAKILRSASSNNSEPKPVKTKKAKSRVELDDFDSSSEGSSVEEPARAPSKQARPIPGAFPDSYIATPQTERSNPATERLSESPVQVSPVIGSQSYPPALVGDTSSQEEPASPVSSPSPDLIDAEEARDKRGAGSSTASTSNSTWSDAHLRTFFDDDADIKDLLVVVYDKSGVVPAGPDHPITGSLFREENAKLADITNRLDGMLGDWLARKSRAQR